MKVFAYILQKIYRRGTDCRKLERPIYVIYLQRQASQLIHLVLFALLPKY